MVLLIAYFIFNYIDGYRYYAVHKVGSINLNYEFSSLAQCNDTRNVSRDTVLSILEQYHADIQDEEEYQKLYQAVENKDAGAFFVISHGAPILYYEYYNDVDNLFCFPVCGNGQPDRLYIYRVYRKIPAIG